MKRRRSLSALGGEVRTWGDPAWTATLTRALRAAETEPSRALTHGFHSYPARMHPAIARTVLREITGGRVLDPFCGSGTVLIESLVAGRSAIGADLSPLALRIVEVTTRLCDAPARARFEQLASQVAEASLARVRGRVSPHVPLPAAERRWYDPHVLLELAGLLEEICSVAPGADRKALEVVFSSLVVKVSRQHADTAERTSGKRVRKGLTTELFARKAQELVTRWQALYAATPKPAANVAWLAHDARRIHERLRAPVDLVLSSPPYGGTYDYHSHHRRRLAWLGLEAEDLARHEIGARRRLAKHPAARRRWDTELGQVLGSLAKGLAAGGHVVLLLGDAQVGGQRVPADVQLRTLAPRAGLQVIATAAQPRPEWHAGPRRAEHLIALAPAGAGGHHRVPGGA